MKAYPSPQSTTHSFLINLDNPNGTKEWWDLMAYVHSEFPRLKDEGLQGYYGMFGPPVQANLSFWSIFYLFDQPNGTAEALFGPIRERLGKSKNFVSFVEDGQYFDNFMDAYAAGMTTEAVASGGGAMGSRLLSRRALTEEVDKVATTFEKIQSKDFTDPVSENI
jgi:hypothetical protein